MSFGDIASAHTLAHPPSGLAPPAISELQRLLKPLSANNAALRQASARLTPPDPHAPLQLKRIRALREQNRQIARAAAATSANLDSQLPGRHADIVQRADRVKRQFQNLLDDFSNALAESLHAERNYLHTVANGESPPPPPAAQLSESQLAVEEDTIAHKTPSEKDPLLPRATTHTPREQAALREIQSNDAFVQERHAVLADVQSSIDDVNAIFKDLAVMITDQTAQVEHVEISVSDAAHNVAGARRELEKTQKRRDARKRFFFVTLLSIAGIIAVFLIFLLS